jgi:hypothetical protein
MSMAGLTAEEIKCEENNTRRREDQTYAINIINIAPAESGGVCDKCGTTTESCQRRKWKNRCRKCSAKVLLEKSRAISRLKRKKREVRYQTSAQ